MGFKLKNVVKQIASAVKPIAQTVAKTGLAKLTAVNPAIGLAVGAISKSGILKKTTAAASQALFATQPTQAYVSQGVTSGGMVRTKPGGQEMYGMGGGRMMMTGRGARPAMPGGGGSTGRDIVSAARAGGGGMVAKDGVIRGIVALGGKYLTNRKVVSLAKRIGLEAAAAALGITVLNVAQMIATDASRPSRRRRGISWRELSTTRRTMRRLASMSCYVSKAPVARRKACR
ncbi:MAG: hypothetical protein WCO50_07890 [Synechococcus sp. ELA619]